MAKTKRRSVGFSVNSMMKYIRLAALAAPAIGAALGPGTAQSKVTRAIGMYTGFSIADGSWNGLRMWPTYAGYLATVLATHGISKVAGIIRRL